MMKAGTAAVWISEYTLRKQALRHPDLLLEHYEHLACVIENGEFFADNRGITIVYDATLTTGYWYKACLKVTRCTNEIYVTSFHKARTSDIKAIKRKCTKIAA